MDLSRVVKNLLYKMPEWGFYLILSVITVTCSIFGAFILGPFVVSLAKQYHIEWLTQSLGMILIFYYGYWLGKRSR